MSITEETKVKLPSVRVTKDIIIQICQFVEQQVNELKKIKNEDEEGSEILFTLETKNKTIKTNSAESFIKANWTKQIEEIRIQYFGSLDIVVDIEFGLLASHYFSVSGKDTIKVNGITSKLEEIFDQSRTNNYLFHKPAFIIPISLMIGLIVGIGAHFVYEVYFKHNLHYKFPMASSFVLVIPLSFVAGWLLSWLFPVTEFEDYLIQTKIRKALIPALIAVIVTLIGSAIWKVLTG